MRIVFERTANGWVILEDNEYYADIPDLKTFVNLKRQMKKLFPSIIFFRLKASKSSYVYVSFKDKSDEDYFIVWSSDGIEL